VPVIRRHALGGAPELAQPACMVIVRQALDRASGNLIRCSKEI